MSARKSNDSKNERFLLPKKKKYKNPRYKNYSYNLIKRPATPWGMIGVVL